MPEVAAVYLARKHSGLESLRRFLRSYERHPCGLEHDLVVVFKGFSRDNELAEWRAELIRFPHREFRMSDFGFDIRAYSMAAGQLPHRYLCFLNSFSELLAADWLRTLHRWVLEPGVGVVGCTGAWTSIFSIVEQEFATAATQPIFGGSFSGSKSPSTAAPSLRFPTPTCAATPSSFPAS